MFLHLLENWSRVTLSSELNTTGDARRFYPECTKLPSDMRPGQEKNYWTVKKRNDSEKLRV